MVILGINAYHANASAAIVVDGRLIAAVEEERFNRVKYAAGFPAQAVRYCLDAAGLKLTEVDHVAVPRDPWARLGARLRFGLRMPRFALDRLRVMGRFAGLHRELAAALDCDPGAITARFHRIEHHQAHLASTFFVSPFESAAALSADGLGDFASTMWATGEGSRFRVHGVISFPHSLGIYYTALTQYLGFRKFGDEYKVMGLAACGQPAYEAEFRRILQSRDGLNFRLGLEFFRHHISGAEMTWRNSGETPVLGQVFSSRLETLLGPARSEDQPLEARHRDIAAAMQNRLEEVLLEKLNALHQLTRQTSLCLAGGVAFNCVANGKIFERTPFERVYVQPAAGDAGLSVGAAFFILHQVLGAPRRFVMENAYWGPQYAESQLRAAIDSRVSADAGIRRRQFGFDALPAAAARYIAEGKVVGWYQGRAEWGPRALGNRSILADPRRPGMKDVLNRRIKHRETFRPFAPSILEESVDEYFLNAHPSPFMTFAFPVRPEKRATIPAPVHLDGTARLQTVRQDANPLFWRLIHEFANLTGVPAVVNTSFNDNEPIVCRPEEALDCFLRTRMDVLVMGETILEKVNAGESEELSAPPFMDRTE